MIGYPPMLPGDGEVYRLRQYVRSIHKCRFYVKFGPASDKNANKGQVRAFGRKKSEHTCATRRISHSSKASRMTNKRFLMLATQKEVQQ